MCRDVEHSLRVAVGDPGTVARYRDKIVRPGGESSCWIWVGAVSGQGHGRFRLDSRRVVVAHRFGWLLAHPGEAMPVAVTHDCDNPLCQNPAHLRAGTIASNRLEYVARAGQPGSPLNDLRGARARAIRIRDAARAGLPLAAIIAAGASEVDRDQPGLW